NGLSTRRLVDARSLSKISSILWTWKLVKNCFLQGLKIRILNATEPIGYLQVSEFVWRTFRTEAVIEGVCTQAQFCCDLT
uniref:Ubiquitin specific peptidase 10 n=1 Tax=Sus scrofa TaxID=9823 RepID=A0A8D2BIK1_PIG